jgi:hypothetical protein
VAKTAIMLDEMLTIAQAESALASLPREQVCLALIVHELCSMAGAITAQHRLCLSGLIRQPERNHLCRFPRIETAAQDVVA